MYRVSTFILAALLLTIPTAVTYAQISVPFVPCGNPDQSACQTCHLFELGSRLLNWLILIMSSIIAIIFVIGGLKMVTSGGSGEGLTSAKSMMTNAVVGFVIILAAWLIVDTIFKVIINRNISSGNLNLGVWNSVQCVEPPARTEQTGTSTATGTVTASPRATPGCPTCVAVSPGVATCKTASSCTVSEEYYERLQQLSTKMEISEGFPPTRVHQNACHTNGTCTDVVFPDRQWTPERVAAFQAEADRAGLRAVFEPGTSFNGGSCQGFTNCQPYSVTRATASHFSLYLK